MSLVVVRMINHEGERERQRERERERERGEREQDIKGAGNQFHRRGVPSFAITLVCVHFAGVL